MYSIIYKKNVPFFSYLPLPLGYKLSAVTLLRLLGAMPGTTRHFALKQANLGLLCIIDINFAQFDG